MLKHPNRLVIDLSNKELDLEIVRLSKLDLPYLVEKKKSKSKLAKFRLSLSTSEKEEILALFKQQEKEDILNIFNETE